MRATYTLRPTAKRHDKGCFGGALPGEKKMAKKGAVGHKLYRKMDRANRQAIYRRLNILKSRDQKWLKARMKKKEAKAAK